MRARLAWARISHEAAAEAAGVSLRSFRYRLAAEYPFQVDELGGLAELLDVKDIGVFFRVPEGFAPAISVSESACTTLALVSDNFAWAA